jgi:hypothetical protein
MQMRQISYWFAVVAVAAMILGGTSTVQAAQKQEKGKAYDGLYFNAGVGAEVTDSRWAWQMNVGYAPCRYFALEGGYVYLGDTPDVNGGRDGFHIVAQPRIPIHDLLTLFGKVGSVIGTFDNEDHAVLTYGAGFAVHLPWNFEARLEYERYDLSHKLNTIMAGLNWYLP